MKEIFLKAIQEDRYDRTTRLAYADWLEENGFDDEAEEQRNWSEERERSIEYLENFAKGCYDAYDDDGEHTNALTYQELIEAAEAWITKREYYRLGTTSYNDANEEFWDHFDRATGRNTKDSRQRGYFFSCSC